MQDAVLLPFPMYTTYFTTHISDAQSAKDAAHFTTRDILLHLLDTVLHHFTVYLTTHTLLHTQTHTYRTHRGQGLTG
jgi:hypothetical protein